MEKTLPNLNLVTHNVDLSPVRGLYDKIVNIEEYFHPVLKWTCLLPDGTDVRDEGLYYQLEAGATSQYQIIPDVRERIVQLCIDAGATMIQFRCTNKDGNKEYGYPDYKVSELIKKP